MLLTFTVENYRSFRDPATLDMRSKSGAEPVAAIYGPNAAGKSALWSAINQLSDLVRDSYRNTQRRPLRTAFALDQDSKAKPTRFDVEFVAADQNRYGYTLMVSDQLVISESLYLYRTARPTLLFDRVADNASDFGLAGGEPGLKFGTALTGPNRSVAATLRPDSLFLSAAAAANHAGLTAVVAWLSQALRCYHSHAYAGAFGELFDRMDSDASQLRNVVDVLRDADVGITSGTTLRRKLTEAEISAQRQLLELLAEDSSGLVPPAEEVTFELTHVGDGGDYSLPFSEESDGTRALTAHADVITRALAEGAVCVFDEIDSSLHPEIVRYLVSMFTDPVTNSRGAQLIFTTHDVSLLNSVDGDHPLLREHVWLVDKDPHGASSLYPLTDFGVRKEENLMRGYLTGRYGAFPRVSSRPSAVGVSE